MDAAAILWQLTAASFKNEQRTNQGFIPFR